MPSHSQSETTASNPKLPADGQRDHPESQPAAQSLQGLQQDNPTPPEGEAPGAQIKARLQEDGGMGAAIVRALEAGPCKPGQPTETTFSEDLRAQLQVVKDQKGSAAILPACLTVIATFTRNLVKQLTPNFVAMIFLAAVIKYELHGELLSAHPELKKRRDFERFLLLQIGLSIDDDSNVSRMCRVGAAALEALDAGLPITIHPNPMIELLPTAKTPAEYLEVWRKLVAAANGQTPETTAITAFMEAWRRKKNADKAETPAFRAAKVRKDLKSEISKREPDRAVITKLLDDLDIVNAELREAPRPKKAPKKTAKKAANTAAEKPTLQEAPPELPETENRVVQGVALERRGIRVLVHAISPTNAQFNALIHHLKNEQGDKPFHYERTERCQNAPNRGAMIRDYESPAEAAKAYAAVATWCQAQGAQQAGATGGAA